MQVPEKEIQANCRRDEESIKSKPSTIYKHKKFLRSRFEKAMSLEEKSSSLNVSSLGPKKLEKVTTAAAQPPLPPNPPPPDNPPMIDILKHEIVDDENKCGSTESLTEFNQPKELTAAAPVATTTRSEEQPSVTMCRDFARGTCKMGVACIFAHRIILSQLPGVYIFCKDFQNAGCSLPKCKFVHATVYQQEHYLSTGYLPPYTLAHLEEFSVLQPPPPPPQFEEALVMQPTVYCNVPPPPPPISCIPAVGYNVEAARERSKRDIFRAQPGTSTSSQNPERREIDRGMYFNTKLFPATEAMSIEKNSSSLNVSSLRQNLQRKVTTAAALPPLPPSPPPPMFDILKHDIEDDEIKCGSTESLTEFNQQEELTAAAPVNKNAQSEKQPSVRMCRNFIRGLCRLGAACKFEHEVILSQLPGVYVFCNNFQNARCSLPKCKLVHATVFEQQHFYRTGYLPPHTLAHLKESGVVAPPPLPPQSEEASPEQSTVYCNVPRPPPSISCTSAMAVGYNAEATRERSKLDTFRAQPGTSTSSQNRERSEIDQGMFFSTKLFSATEAMSIEENSSSSNVSSLGQNIQRKFTTAAALPPLPPSPPPPMIDILKHDIEDDENKCGSTESLTEFNQEEKLSKPVTITAESEKQATLTMCRNFVRGICRLGERCIFEHEIILSQLPGVYTFCRHFQNSVCPFLKCKFVHATVFEQEHFFRTGYLPLHTRAHLKEFSLLQTPPQSEASAEQPTFQYNVPPPPPPLSCTPGVAEEYTSEAARKRSKPDIFRAQPGTSTSSQNPERSEIDQGMYFNTKLFPATEAMSIEQNSSSSNVSSLGQNLLKKEATTPALAALLPLNPPPRNEIKRGSTESLTDFNQEEELTAAAPVATTAQTEEKPSVTMCRDFVRGTCKKGVACIFAHQIILSQLPWVYTFCRNFQNSICSSPCKFVHANVFEKEHFYRTGYLPPHTLAHLQESSVVAPPPPPPQSEEASAEELKVNFNVPPPPSPISCTPGVGYNVEAARERSNRDIFRAQSGPSTSSQNSERREIDKGMYFNTKMSIEENSSSSNVSSLGQKTAAAQPPLPRNPPPTNENKRGSTESLTEFKQEVSTTTGLSKEQPSVTMCRNFARGNCKKGMACMFKHEIILSQLPGVYTFCRNFQNAECSLPKCKFVHATVFEKEHFYRTGYLPPHAVAHLKESNVLTPTPPPPQSEETFAMQPTVYCNVPPPPPPISCTPPVAVGYNAVATRERSEPDIFRPQPGTSSQNVKWRGIDEASSSTCDDSAERCNKCPSREQRELDMDAKIADARRRLDAKRKQMAKIDMECEIMDAIISMYNNHLNQENQAAELASRRRPRH